jgi:diguanylate cyclase (GGDEF)-like protein
MMISREVPRSASDLVPPARVLVPALATGGVLCFLSLLVPGYMIDETWARIVMVGFGLSAFALSAASRRLGPGGRPLFAIMLWGDVATVVLSGTLSSPGPGLAAVAVFALPSVTVALFGTRRMLAVQGLLAAVAGGVILSRSEQGLLGLALQTLTAVFATTSPAVAVLVLRERLQQVACADRDLAVTDHLTGVANRRGLEEALPRVRSGARSTGRPIGVVVLDIDHFKAINDRHGHATGDAVLQRVAHLLTAHTGAEDIVARLGGEEFAVLTLAEPVDLAALAETLRREVAQASSATAVTVSAGVAWDETGLSGPEPAEQLWSLVDRADELMYAAKRDGRDRVRVDPR